MGVPGLWEVLNEVGKSTSLLHLAVTHGFEQNSSKRRGYRLGIDASIWFHHATFSKSGENPELRGLFFRLMFLAKLPIIPLFVFDGRQRPKTKRGSRLGKSGNHPLEMGFKELINAFGMEWREAPGEAEAELAYLNKQNYIDAIMTDDCDAFIFGARTVLKNLSANLSGNKNNAATNSEEKTDKFHGMLYSATDIATNNKVGLSRGGMILFALLSGGDYHKGVDRVGKKIAYALARCGFGDELLETYEATRIDFKPEFMQFLLHWRARVNVELKENTKGYLPHRTTLTLPENFPDLEVLEQYAFPTNSGSGKDDLSTNSTALRDRNNLNLAEIAKLCEKYFEWGYREKIIERFRNLLWPCAVMRLLRHVALEVDQRFQAAPSADTRDIGTPASLVQKYLKPMDRMDRIASAFVNQGTSQPTTQYDDRNQLILKIVGSRRHPSTDLLEEYRVEVSPSELVIITNSGIKGIRKEPDVRKETKKAPPSANDLLRLWIPASMVRLVHPTLVKDFTERKGQSGGKKGKGKAKETDKEEVMDFECIESDEELQVFRPRNLSQQALDNNSGFIEQHTELDPWFLAQPQLQVPFQKKSNTQGFLFTFPNPALENPCLEDVADAPVDQINSDASTSYMDTDVPQTFAEKLVDSILTKGRRTGPVQRKKRKCIEEHTSASVGERPTKKQNKSSGSRVLDALDMLI